MLVTRAQGLSNALPSAWVCFGFFDSFPGQLVLIIRLHPEPFLTILLGSFPPFPSPSLSLINLIASFLVAITVSILSFLWFWS